VTALHDATRKDFGSDNYAGVHPEVLAALIEANGGHVPSYGADPYTERLREVLSDVFGRPAQVYPVLNGTGANVVALQSMLPRWGGVVCTELAHINTDENGAPERVGGLKLLPVPAPDGRLTADLVAAQMWGHGDEHHAQVGVVSITQSTEVGTVYEVEQLRELCEQAHGLGLRVHMDGARLANAAVHLGVPLAAITGDVGVDVLSLGGTKLGALFGEAVVVLDENAAVGVPFLRKIDTQLASKMRFVSAQLLALYGTDLWSRSAGTANAMAARLRAGLEQVPGVHATRPTQANAVFASMPAGMAEQLRRRWHFYDWSYGTDEVRLMCAFDTTAGDVDEFVTAAREVAGLR